MNKKMIEIFECRIYLFVAIFSLIFVSIAFCETPEGIHYRTGIYYPYDQRKIKFRDVPSDLSLIKKFPIEELLKDSKINYLGPTGGLYDTYSLFQFDTREGKTLIVDLDYWVYTSVNEAEEAITERLLGTNMVFTNAIDLNLEGEIGDNCWYVVLDYAIITFTRNNVRVFVRADCWWCPFDKDIIFEFAKKVDGLLIDMEKVEDAKLIPAPVINSIKIVKGYPKSGEPSTFYIDALDPNGQKLTYIFRGDAACNRSNDGFVRTFMTNDVFASLQIWVYNEDHIVASAVYFLETSVTDDEGTAAGHPQAFTLFQNLPNPFNQATAISYELKRAGVVSLRVYDLLGHEVAALEEGYREPGRYRVFWNGKDSKGNPVSSGIYLYSLTAGGKEETKRMTLVR